MTMKSSSNSKTKKTKDEKPKSTSKKRKEAPPKEDAPTTPSNKKRALKQQRQSQTRRHYDTIQSLKSTWAQLNHKKTTSAQILGLMKELMTLLEGKMKEVAMQHDSSRIIQSAIKFGTEEQRHEVLMELSEIIPELCKVQYAHFIVLKMIKNCVREKNNQKIIVKAFKGQMSRLAVHSIGARTIEQLLSTFPPKSTALLRQEFYGPQFALFASGEFSSYPTLSSILEKHPEKSNQVKQYVLDILQKGIEKELFQFLYFQQLLWEYIDCCSYKEIMAMMPSLVDHSIHLLSTRYGSMAMSKLASYGTAKDRRRIIKSLKGFVRSTFFHRDGYIALLTLIYVTDDTVTVQKALLDELLSDEENASPMLDLALDDNASKLLLLLLPLSLQESARYFSPWEVELLEPVLVPPRSDEETTSMVSTSKKPLEIRYKELLLYFRQPLEKLWNNHSKELMTSISGSKVLYEVYLSFASNDLAMAIINACQDDPSIFEDVVAHRFIKNIILLEAPLEQEKEKHQRGKEAIQKSGVSFASKFYSTFSGQLLDVVASSNRGAFVVAALVGVNAVKNDVVKELKKNLGEIKEKAEKWKGFEVLLNAIQGKK